MLLLIFSNFTSLLFSTSWENFFSPKDVEQMLPSSLGEIDVCGMVLNPRLSTIMDFKLDENDIDVNWIGAYTWQRIS